MRRGLRILREADGSGPAGNNHRNSSCACESEGSDAARSRMTPPDAMPAGERTEVFAAFLGMNRLREFA
ncbi:MAG: hypothetical protein AAB113_03810, partial [Candidatus Eisenbacteria bacterium]